MARQHFTRTYKSSKNDSSVVFVIQGIAIGLILVGLGILVWGGYPIIASEVSYEWNKRVLPLYTEATPTPAPTFGEVLEIAPPLRVDPINQTNAVIIEKIGVNTPIVWDVSVTDKNAYMNALNSGVAHASISVKPSKLAGNTYLFAHSTLNPLEIERYAAEFTLLHRLDPGDRITVMYNEVRYDYEVEDKSVVKGFDTTPLTRQPDYSMLTLQTCDPPGIPQNRLIITAKLIGSYPAEKV